MVGAEEDLGETELHLAGTKPAMVPIVQIPWTSLVLLIGISAFAAEIYWKYALLTFPFWPVGFFIFRKDHNGLRVFAAWARTAGLDFSAWWFGGTSVDVFPTRRDAQFRGIPHAEG